MDALGHTADRVAAGTSSAASWPTTSPTGTTRGAQRQLVALGSALDQPPVDAPAVLKAELEQASAVVARATRSRVAADLGSTRVLRRSVQAIWRDRPQDRDGAGFVRPVDALLTAVASTRHWHRTRQHAQQEAAAEQTLLNLQVAYEKAADAVLVGLASRAPSPQTKHRCAHHLQDAVPEHAERLVADSVWGALATALAKAEAEAEAEAEAAGHNLRSSLIRHSANAPWTTPQPRPRTDLAHPPLWRAPCSQSTSRGSARARSVTKGWATPIQPATPTSPTQPQPTRQR